MACCAYVAPAVVLHVNILIVLYAGALLSVGARLAWDPSLYAWLRALAPGEFRAACVAVPLLAAGLLLPAHVAAAAVLARSRAVRRALLLAYAVLALASWAGQLALLWAARSHAALLLARRGALTALAADLREALRLLAHIHTVPDAMHQLFDEAWADVWRSAYCAGGAGALLLLLQPLAVVAALVARATLPPARRPTHRPRSRSPLLSNSITSEDSRGSEQRKLKAVYRNGKLALV